MKNVRLIALAASVAALAVAGTAVAAANTTVVTKVTGSCVVARSGTAKSTTSVAIAGSNVASAFNTMTGCQAPVAIVQRIARTGVEMPFNSQGFRCTPSMTGSTGRWKCLFQAADTATRITLSFSYRY